MSPTSFRYLVASFVFLIMCNRIVNSAHLSGSLGIIDDIMHYGKHNVSAAVQDSLTTDLKSDDLIFPESKPIDRSDFVHWSFDVDEIVKVKDGKYTSDYQRIDMSDFVALVPAEEVQKLVAKYFQRDTEVQRGYAYLRSKHFASLKDKIIAIPEMNDFLTYMNNSGLDVVNFVYSLTNLTGQPEDYILEEDSNENSTTTLEGLHGIHGLVDSILITLPQDQILSLFFDKLETNAEFSKLVENIGSPEFERILHKLEDSIALRNVVYTLHNNGIYITRIVDSLKGYFFLGRF